MKLPTIVSCVLALSSLSAPALDSFNNLEDALAKASAEDKALFIMYGRPGCSNCQALHKMIDRKDVRLPKTAFVLVDLNCDDPATSEQFKSRYKVQGNVLPFVVIAKPDGTQVASRSGYGTSSAYNDFVQGARREIKSAP